MRGSVKMHFIVFLMFILINICGCAATANRPHALSELEREPFQRIKRICVTVEQTYGQADKVTLPFFDYSKSVLAFSGFQAIHGTSASCEATLSIKAEGTPEGARYSDNNVYYTGAKVYGSMAISVADKIITQHRFGGHVPVASQLLGQPDKKSIADPSRVTFLKEDDYADPNRAPFLEALHSDRDLYKGFFRPLLIMIYEIKGIEPLIATLKDTDSNARKGADIVLREVKDPRVVEPLIETLKSNNPYLKAVSAKHLGELNDHRAVDPLINILRDNDTTVRKNAIEALAKLKDSRAVDQIMLALNDQEPNVRKSAAEALGILQDPRAVAALVTAIRHETDLTVKSSEKLARFQIKDARTVAPLIDVLNAQSGKAPVNIKDPGYFELLVSALKNDDFIIRRRVAKEFIILNDPRAFDQLLATTLNDEDSLVRGSAGNALGKLKDPRAIEPLIAALKDCEFMVCIVAAQVLREITNQQYAGLSYGYDYKKWKAWLDASKK